MKKWNVPNKITFARILAVPINMIILMLPESVLPFMITRAIAGFVFIITAFTDMLDGKIARKYGLITDFGKFLDPIADKIMVTGVMLCIMMRCEEIRYLFFVAIFVIIFREFAVTSMRLIMAGNNTVIAASKIGKVKTVMQIVSIGCALLEPVLYHILGIADVAVFKYLPLTWISTVLAVLFTVISGVDYIAKYWKYLDPEK